MFAKALIIASLAFCGVASYELSPSESCGNLPTPENLYIENCEYFPCPIYTGFNVNALWNFVATNGISQLKPVAKYSVFGLIWLNYKDLEIDGCNSLVGDTQCPLQPNDVGTFMLSFPVPDVPIPMKSISIWIEFSLLDQDKNVQSCFRVQFSVKKGH